jgi:hypothetical protein
MAPPAKAKAWASRFLVGSFIWLLLT